jgi:hypothetical protein
MSDATAGQAPAVSHEGKCSRCDEQHEACTALNCGRLEEPIQGTPYHRCGNCGAEYERDGAHGPHDEITHFWERHGAGDMVGSGECTGCGALVFPIYDTDRCDLSDEAAALIADTLRTRLLRNLKGRPDTTTITGWINRTVTPKVLQDLAGKFNDALRKRTTPPTKKEDDSE